MQKTRFDGSGKGLAPAGIRYRLRTCYRVQQYRDVRCRNLHQGVFAVRPSRTRAFYLALSSVTDSFPAFIGFDAHDKTSAMIPTSASCYSCHAQHAAVDTTFIQFYPTVLPIANSKGTLSAAYLKEIDPETPVKK